MKCPAKGLEDSFSSMVVVSTRQSTQMERNPGARRKRSQELDQILSRDLADVRSRKSDFAMERAFSAKVDRGKHECVLDRHVDASDRDDRVTRGCCFAKGCSKHRAHVHERMQIVDMKIALRADAQIEVPGQRKQLKQVVEKAQTGPNISARAAIESEHDAHSGLARLALQFGVTDFAHRFDIPLIDLARFLKSKGPLFREALFQQEVLTNA